MRKLGTLAALVAIVLCGFAATSRAAVGADYKWVTEPLPYSDGTFVKTLSAVKDSARTATFDTSKLAWEALPLLSGTGTSPGITLIATTTAAGADTVYFGFEPGCGGKFIHTDPLDVGIGLGANTLPPKQGLTGATGNGKLFEGPLYYDVNTLSAAPGTVFGIPQFRLMIRNNAAVGALTNLRLFIRYPKRTTALYTWAPKQVMWVRSTGIKDTVNIAAGRDSCLTATVNMSDAAWDLINANVQATTPTGALVFFTATSATGSDSIFYGLQTGWHAIDGGGGFVRIDPLDISPAVTDVASSQALTAGGAGLFNANLFGGLLNFAPGAWVAANNNIFKASEFRLLVRSATASTLTGLKCYVVYPHRTTP